MQYYNRDGEPISAQTWAGLNRNEEYQRLAHTHVGNYLVSTIWLGIDMGFSGTGKPIIFETMVFDQGPGSKRPWNDLEQRRYATEEEALAGHAALVEEVRLINQLKE